MPHRLTLLLLLATSLPAHAQRNITPNQGATQWAAVEQLPAGKRIEIRTQHQWLRCAFIAADNASVSCHADPVHSLFVSIPARDEIVPRADVDSLRTFGSHASYIGTAIGGGFGVILGLVSDTSAADRTLSAVAGGLAGGFFGYCIGSFIDTVRDLWPRHAIYRRP